jgi:hypothetical protein
MHCCARNIERLTRIPKLKAFSLLLCTGKISEVRLFLRKSRAEIRCLYTPEVKMP